MKAANRDSNSPENPKTSKQGSVEKAKSKVKKVQKSKTKKQSSTGQA